MNSKRIWAIALCGHFLISVPAMAQDENPIKVPLEKPVPAVQIPTTFQLEVDQAELTAISNALMELPKKVADPIILKLNAQLQKQMEARNPKPAEEKK